MGGLLAFSPESAAQELFITEFMAENDSALADADGEHPDWLEFIIREPTP
jgi:hypothetical protein